MALTAHPMILPHVLKDSAELASLSKDAQQVFNLLYDMVDGFASDQPSWQVRRWLINLDGALFAVENTTLHTQGWRAVASLSGLAAPSTGLTTVTSLRGTVAHVTDRSLSPYQAPPISLGDFIAHMEQEGLGRPSTYAAHAQTLLDFGLIASLSDVSLTPKGRTMLQSLRQNGAARYDAEFTKEFLRQLDDIESGKRDPEDSLSEWLNPVNASIAAQWLDGCQIQGDAAAIFYEARDETDRTYVFWPAGGLPKELDPELALPPDSPHREHRAQLNRQAAESAREQWQQFSDQERVERRIAVAAQHEQIPAENWKEVYQFDLLRRWLVGWV